MQEFSGLNYLRIEIANNYGLDKKNWTQRIEWVLSHENELEDRLKEAEEPALYYASVKAYRDAEEGKLIYYPISLDATTSGMQLLAVMTGDAKAAKHCNVINTGNRIDAYTDIYNIMKNKIHDTTSKIAREHVKKAIMTSLYGSVKKPKDIFGEGDLYAAFNQTMEEELPYVWEANKVFLDIWNPKTDHYDWVLPDNFHAHVKNIVPVKEIVHFMNEPIEITHKVQKPSTSGRSIGANLTHSVDGLIVREMCRRCMFDTKHIEFLKRRLIDHKIVGEVNEKDNTMVQLLLNLYEKSGFLSARILQYLNGTNYTLIDPTVLSNLLNSLPEKPFEIICIHDCFRCLPNYGNDVRKQYQYLLYAIHKSNMLQFILQQITGNTHLTVHKQYDFSKEILENEYALS